MKELIESGPIEYVPPTLREALTEARAAIASLPEESLGIANANDPDPGATRWYIRDELLAYIDAALTARQEIEDG